MRLPVFPALVPTSLAMIAALACGGSDRRTPGESGGAREDAGGDAGDPEPRPDGGFGAARECYGIADDLRELFAIDRETGQATHLCSVPAEVPEVDAISSHPVSGDYYFVAQADLEVGPQGRLGRFVPDTCVFETIGDLELTEIGGLSFHPETAELYGGDELASAIYRFGKDAAGAPTTTATLVADVPLVPKSIAIQPATGIAFVSDATSIFSVDLASGGVGTPMPLSVIGIQALFFTSDGQLYGTVGDSGDPPDRLVKVDPANGGVVDVGGFNPVAYLPGTTARPSANDVEAMECNVAGACDDCVE